MSLAKITLDYVSGDGTTLRTHLLTCEAERVQWLVARPEGIEQHRLLRRLRGLQRMALTEGFALALAGHDMNRARAHNDALILLLELEIGTAEYDRDAADDESRVRAEESIYNTGLALATHRTVSKAVFGDNGPSIYGNGCQTPASYPEAMSNLASL
jgi:hypothetical protein